MQAFYVIECMFASVKGVSLWRLRGGQLFTMVVVKRTSVSAGADTRRKMKVMADLLGTIGLLIAGGAISMSSQYLQRRWSRDDLRAFLTVVRESEAREESESDLDDAEREGFFDSEEDWRRVRRLRETLESYPFRYEVNPAARLAKLNAPTKEIEDAIETVRNVAINRFRLDPKALKLCLRRLDAAIESYRSQPL